MTRIKSKFISDDMTTDAELAVETSAREAADQVFEDIFTDIKEPTGFVDRSESTLSFNSTTRTLTLAPVSGSYEIYTQGAKRTISSNLTATIPDTTGPYFFYIDTTGALQVSNTFSIAILDTFAYTAYLYWNSQDGDAILFAEERHGISMDGATHGYLHTTRGLQLVSGASITFNSSGDGSADSHAQVGISDLSVSDEDIRVQISHAASPSSNFEQVLASAAQLPVLYRSGASSWRKNTATAFPLQQGTARPQYNQESGGSFSLVDASADGKFLVYHIFATTSYSEPVIVVPGQTEYDTLISAAEQGTWAALNLGDFPAEEIKLLYTLIFEVDSTFTNTPKARLVQVIDERFQTDRASISTLDGVTSSIQIQLDNKEPTITGGASTITSANLPVDKALVSDAGGKVDVSATTSTELGYVSGVTSSIQTQLDSLASEDLTFLKLNGTRAMTGALDLNQNNILSANKVQKKIIVTTPTFTTASTSGTLNLNNSSSTVHFITGSATGYSVVMPDATTLDLGVNYEIYNRTSSPITIKYFDGTTVVGVLSAESVSSLCLQDNTTTNGLFSPFSIEIDQASGIANYTATSTTAFATTATNTYQQITDFVVTPAAGKYSVLFNCTALSTNNNSENYVALYKDGVIIADTERRAQSVSSNFRFQLNTLGIIDFDGTQELQVWVQVSSGTLTINARTGVALRLGPAG